MNDHAYLLCEKTPSRDDGRNLTTDQAAALAGMSAGQFRAHASQQRKLYANEMHAPVSEWPNKRTPVWDEARVKAWLAERAEKKREAGQ